MSKNIGRYVENMNKKVVFFYDKYVDSTIMSVARILWCMFIMSVFGIAEDIILNIDVSGPQQDSSSRWCDVKKSRRSQSWLLILTCRESYVKFW